MASSSSSSSRSYSHDVFLSFRGEDTRKTFVDHLYKALTDRLLRTYKDDITLPRGESVGPALLKAIEESRHAVIIFSKKYANSSWCLDELVHIMKCRAEKGQIVMPIFYDVDPSDVRKQKGEFGEAFAEQEGDNVTKAESWRKALVDASNISGWEPKNVANGHEAVVIQTIVDAISNNLLSPNLDIDEDEEFVGMTDRVKDLISRLKIGTGGVRMVGIWGVGGGGKTTLATSVYMEISQHFGGHCIVENIREESRKHDRTTLQAKILSTLLETQVGVQSEEEGKRMIRNRLCRSNVLILLDDVDDPKQLEALAGSHKWFGDGSRIMITTRDEHVLRTRKVDHISPVTLLSQDEGSRLFKKHAYNEEEPLKVYGKLSLRVVSYADGLPLALKVLGSFLYDKDEKEWMSTLDRLKEIPESEIVEKLKISYDGLKKVEKELFLDIAFFFRGEAKDRAMEILDACDFYPDIGIRVLIQKALITINSNGKFDMHDLVQEMGHYIVRGEHPNNPEKHSRLRKYEEIRNMYRGDTTMENDTTEVVCLSLDHRLLYSKNIANMKKLRWFIAERGCIVAPDSLPNELRYIEWTDYPGSPFPDSFQPMNLVALKMCSSLQKELWEGRKHLPRLKVLQLRLMENLVSTPDFDGFPSLQKLTIIECNKLEEIHPSLGNHRSLKYITVDCSNLKRFPKIDHMKKLETLDIISRRWKFEIPEIQTDMENLVKLSLDAYGIQGFISSVAEHCPNLISITATDIDYASHRGSNNFSKFDLNLSRLTVLVHLDLSFCEWLKKFPVFPSSLVSFVANGCEGLTDIGDVNRNCKWLCQVSVIGGGNLNDGDRLLQSMLQGKATENHSMVLQLEGLQIPRDFRPRLRAGRECTLQLPQNWCNDFSGFLMCAVIDNAVNLVMGSPEITMKQVRDGLMGIDSQDYVVWKESADFKTTWVGYVSFGSLRHTAAWLDETCKAVSFSFCIPTNPTDMPRCFCHGFGVSLVPRISGSYPTDTSPPEYYSEFHKQKYDFKPKFEIEDDYTCTFRIPSINDKY
ncbi:Toll/interleukin-1 receptor domain-containing protein [Tanacetum coccineum]